MTTPTDPTITEIFASVQRTLAESIRVQREAIERVIALKLQVAAGAAAVARLLAENAQLRAQLDAATARTELRAAGVLQ